MFQIRGLKRVDIKKGLNKLFNGILKISDFNSKVSKELVKRNLLNLTLKLNSKHKQNLIVITFKLLNVKQ